MITDAQIGKQIWNLRAERNMRQSTLCDELLARGIDLDRSAISRMESGQRLIKATELMALADVFAIPLDDFIPNESQEERIQRLEMHLDRVQRQRACLDYEAAGIQAELDSLKAGAL